MRRSSDPQLAMLTSVSTEELIPPDRPIPKIGVVVDAVLAELDSVLEQMHAAGGRRSVPVDGVDGDVFDPFRAAFCERLNYDLLFKWFLDIRIDQPAVVDAVLRHDRGVSHTLIADPAREVTIQAGAVVSKVIHRGDGLNVTVFGFDAGEELTAHQVSRAALVQVMSGRLRFTVDDEPLDLGPGSWLHMAPEASHSLVASEPTVMLLTLIGE